MFHILTLSLAWLYWDPHRDIMTIPYINRPIAWYGLCFVIGFFIGYRIFNYLLNLEFSKYPKIYPAADRKNLCLYLSDRALWFIMGGTVIGARLGHVFFYDWPRYQDHWMDILKVWEGGLASHGGAVGVIIALIAYHRLYREKAPTLSFFKLLDLVTIPTALVGFFIRIGNFFNQEILGNPTHVFWAVIFGHPADGSPAVPRHPAQLYEAISYLIIFIFLFFLWKSKKNLHQGIISGLFFILIFTSRFFIEFIKIPQSLVIDETYIQMGQYLSIPFIIAGFALLFYGCKSGSCQKP